LLATDLEDGSTVGALSRLHPAERELLVESQTMFTDELKRLEIIRPDADLTTMSATFSGLRFDESAAETVRDDVVITKLVAGTVSMVDDPTRSVFTDAFRDLALPKGGAGAPNTVDIARDAPDGVRIATVLVDGRWYVSGFYTAADYALRAAGQPWPRTTVAARGAATATEALKQTVQAAMDADVRRLVELAPPGELQVLHDVGDALIAAAGRTSPSGVRLLELETTESSTPGGTAVTLQEVVLQNDDGDIATVRRDGSCIVARFGVANSEKRICSFADFSSSGLGGSSRGLTGQPAVDRVLPKLFGVLTNPKIVVVEDGGQHYLSPFRTITTFYGDALRALTAQDVRDLLQAVR
jgi:hypothetical protein